MEQVLLLNISYEPLKVINWKKAITMLCLGKVEVIEEYTQDIHSISFTVKMPSVVRLLSMVKRVKNPVKFSRQNIYARDRYKCQYCGKRFPCEELTYDHVLPKSRGGRTEWENIVTCCMDCNRKKGGRMPHEASMNLIRRPFQPDWVPSIRITIGFKEVPQSWRDYLYWHIELVE
ncbi:MAG: HNH endonuclease [Deltaproteobacteria bacterium]|nr:HNH endonuclease [Deltaproteobacteria bacterium]